MSKHNKRESYFWTSYSDLMTSLFFVMLVLFVLTIALLHNKIVATEDQLKKIQEIEAATKNIDSKYFEYREQYKKHILKIEVAFDLGKFDFRNIPDYTKDELKSAGQSISDFIAKHKEDGVQYMVIIEGQASYYQDGYKYNYELSYNRALALKRFWEDSNICFDANCEVLISGSGDGQLCNTGLMRERDEVRNQRFLVHIVPKYGEFIKTTIGK